MDLDIKERKYEERKLESERKATIIRSPSTSGKLNKERRDCPPSKQLLLKVCLEISLEVKD